MKISLCLEERWGNFFSFFCGKTKLICEIRYTFFIILRLQQIRNLRPAALFYKNLRSTSGKFAYSAVCGATPTTPLLLIKTIPFSVRYFMRSKYMSKIEIFSKKVNKNFYVKGFFLTISFVSLPKQKYPEKICRCAITFYPYTEKSNHFVLRSFMPSSLSP